MRQILNGCLDHIGPPENRFACKLESIPMTRSFLEIAEGRQLDWLLQSAADAMLIADREGRIILANPPALSLFGYSAEEFIDQQLEMLLPQHVRHGHVALRADYFSQPSPRAMGSGRELFARRRDGTDFPVEVSLSPLQTAQGVPLVMATIHDITRRKQAEHALLQSQTELRQLTGHLERIKEAERKRIAQEIHDELGGLLTGIKAYVSVYLERSARSGAQPDQLLVDAVALADSGFQAVRKVITDLRPSVLDQLGVWAALEWYTEQIGKRSGPACTCTIDASAAAIELGPELSTMLFRIVQEALTNAVRHAEASQVDISAKVVDDKLYVEVRDNGKGIDTDPQANQDSWGLVGMYERARYFGGQLTIDGQPGAGSSVRLSLPLDKIIGENEE
jgi:two-component system sensor histidine kinase UhpB